MTASLVPLLAAVGIAAAAGLNVYMVLLILGLVARITGALTLPPPLDLLTSTGVLLALGLLLTLDIFVSKAPQLRRLAERIGFVARPVGGALAALAVTSGSSLDPVVASLVGLAIATLVHWLGGLVRSAVAGFAGGQALPLASLLIDMLAAAGAILTLRAPVVGAAVALLTIAGLAIAARQIRRRPASDLGTAQPPATTND
jgi:hypothetical protein